MDSTSHILFPLYCVASRPEYCCYGHSGSVACVDRSPFFRDIVLSVGGWNWAIWKEGQKVSGRYYIYFYSNLCVKFLHSPLCFRLQI